MSPLLWMSLLVNMMRCVHMSSYNQCLSSSPSGLVHGLMDIRMKSDPIVLSGCDFAAGFPSSYIISSGDTMLINHSLSTRYNERQIRLLEYLQDRVKSGTTFFKSKYIARETGMSSKEVGTNMGILSETCTVLSIRKYSYSNSTTWLVTHPQV